jgi:ribosomal protein S18 acetylase RimI-like enzyme
VTQPTIRRIDADEWQTMRDVRLAALQEAPYAFGSTYARERVYGEDEWRNWLGDAVDPNGAIFVAEIDRHAVGMDAVFIEEESAHLYAMWVAPEARRSGAGSLLTRAAIDWARTFGAPRLMLHVAENNPAGIALYESLGFAMTGNKEPLHSDPSRSVLEMSRALV